MSGPPEPRQPAPPDASGTDSAPVSAAGGAAFAGDFTAAERAYLATQFGRCRIELLRRAAAPDGGQCAVIAWHATPESFGRSGPGPLFRTAMPRRAVYVLHLDPAATTGGRLVRVTSQLDLEREIGERDDSVDLGQPPGAFGSAWDGAKRALRGLMPWNAGRL
jgi:hypothetical protein